MFTEVQNVWENLAESSDEAASLKMRAQLMIAIRDMIREEGWNQHQAADVLGVNQPRVSALMRGKVRDFSIDSLVGFLSTMGWVVDFHYKDEQLSAKATTTEAA